MWRRLSGLNEKDCFEENSLFPENQEKLSPDLLDQFYVLKGIHVFENEKEVLEKIAQKMDGVKLLSGMSQNGQYTLILHFAFHFKERFLSQIEKIENSDYRNLLRAFSTLFDNCERNNWHYHSRGKKLELNSPCVMGILNITPDSFSDNGRFLDDERAYNHAVKMLEMGADIIDLGGESTRPGSEPVTVDEEWRRISTVLSRLSKERDCFISVDTYKSEIARRALDNGAHVINDISGLSLDKEMVDVIAEYQCPVILMHMKGTPQTMQKYPCYTNLMDEIYEFLFRQCQLANKHGIQEIIVDPGIGFGKSRDDNFEILRRVREFNSLGYPIMVGTSRKSFIGSVINKPVKERIFGSLTTVVYSILNNVKLLRVHDVDETRQAIELLKAIKSYKTMSN
jgi:dihydropteroate synthase